MTDKDASTEVVLSAIDSYANTRIPQVYVSFVFLPFKMMAINWYSLNPSKLKKSNFKYNFWGDK